jgi:hypothetical protein
VPPRFAYWTILIDNGPTAFRARDPQELLPTLHQLRRTNKIVTLKWFARGRLWDSPEAERETQREARRRPAERRGKDWRPGGAHKDPRARFDKKKHRHAKRDHKRDQQSPRANHRAPDRRSDERRSHDPRRPPTPHERPDRRDRPPRREPEPPKRPHDTPPEPPPQPERIVIKPGPPERG